MPSICQTTFSPRRSPPIRSGVSPGSALRVAQMKLLPELRAGRVVVQTPAGAMTLPENPALWAGFILLGNT